MFSLSSNNYYYPINTSVETSLKRKRKETSESNEKKARIAKKDFVFPNELLDLIFRESYKQGGLQNLLVIRSLNREWMSFADYLISNLFKEILQLETPHYTDFNVFSRHWPAFYETCEFLYHDGNRFRSNSIESELESNIPQSNTKQIISKYKDRCRQYKAYTFEFLINYHRYLSSIGREFKPSVIKYDRHDDLKENDAKEDIKTRYKKLAPFFTSDLKTFKLNIPFTDFQKITEEGLEGAGRLAKLLFGTKLENLSTLEVTQYELGNLVWSKKFNLTENDVKDLEKLTPNLRYLTLESCFLTDSLFKGLIENPLIAQLESLSFRRSILDPFDSYAYFGQFLREAQMSNLRYLYLPEFRVGARNSQGLNCLNNAISQLKFNSSLTKLKTISFSDEQLDSTTSELLTTIAFNSHLYSLTILNTKKKIVEDSLSEKFALPSIRHIFSICEDVMQREKKLQPPRLRASPALRLLLGDQSN